MTSLRPLMFAVFSGFHLDVEWCEPTPGERNRLRPKRRPGGFAVGAGRQLSALGAGVRPFGNVGPDPAGRFIEETLRQGGFDVRGLRHAGTPTSVTQVILRGDERTVLIDADDVVPLWRPTPEDKRLLADVDVI